MVSPLSLQIQSYLFSNKTAQGTQVSLPEQRAWFDTMIEKYAGHPIPLPEGTRVESVKVDDIPAEWTYPPSADAERAILFLHGGAYIMGSLESHRDLVARLSRTAGVRGLLTDYRLAPEHVFPAALDDALTAYRWLLARGTRPVHIVLVGDSAGGGLALALLETLRNKTLHMPAGAVLLSPWTDLVGTVASQVTLSASDPIFTGDSINALASFYTGAGDKNNPLISPINADLKGFPSLCIDVGSDEVLLDDSLQVAEHAKAANVPVELTVWEGMWHVFQQYSYVFPEGQQSLDGMGRFIRRQTML
jgi:monoterpene epsilon-lactone hydrolase